MRDRYLLRRVRNSASQMAESRGRNRPVGRPASIQQALQLRKRQIGTSAGSGIAIDGPRSMGAALIAARRPSISKPWSAIISPCALNSGFRSCLGLVTPGTRLVTKPDSPALLPYVAEQVSPDANCASSPNCEHGRYRTARKPMRTSARSTVPSSAGGHLFHRRRKPAALPVDETSTSPHASID